MNAVEALKEFIDEKAKLEKERSSIRFELEMGEMTKVKKAIERRENAYRKLADKINDREREIAKPFSNKPHEFSNGRSHEIKPVFLKMEAKIIASLKEKGVAEPDKISASEGAWRIYKEMLESDPELIKLNRKKEQVFDVQIPGIKEYTKLEDRDREIGNMINHLNNNIEKVTDASWFRQYAKEAVEQKANNAKWEAINAAQEQLNNAIKEKVTKA